MLFTKRSLNLVVILTALVLAACTTSPRPQSTAAVATQAPETPSTPSAVASTATDAPAPTETPLPLPSATPRPLVITVDNAAQIVQVAAQEFKSDKGGVYGLAWSPDGQTLAVSAKIPMGITLYDPHLNVQRFITTTAVMYTPAFSHALLAAGGADNVVRVWQVMDGRLLHEIKGHTGIVWANVAFSPDGKLLASGGMDKTVRLWPLDGGEPRVLKHDEVVTSLAFSPAPPGGGTGGTLLASCGKDSIRLWNVADGSPAGVLQAPGESSPWLSFQGPDSLVSTGGVSMHFWQLARDNAGWTGKVTHTLPYENASAFALGPDNSLLAAGNEASQTVSLADASNGQVLYETPGLDGRPMAMAFSPDGAYIAIAVETSHNLDRVLVWGLPQAH